MPNFKLKPGTGQRCDAFEKFRIFAAIMDFGSHLEIVIFPKDYNKLNMNSEVQARSATEFSSD